MDDMPRKLPPYVNRHRTQHGKVKYFYRRNKGPRTRLPDDPSTKEFDEAYKAALSGKAAVIARKAQTPSETLLWLVERYMESGKWAGYERSTQIKNERIYKDTIQRANNPAYKAIGRRTIENGMDDRKGTPSQANNWLKAMRNLLEWAKKNEFVEANVAKDVEYLQVKTSGFIPWTAEDAITFCKRWPIGSKERLAYELYVVSGLRRSDTHRVGPQHLKGNTLSIRAAKPPHHLITVELPAHTLAVIDRTPTGDMAFITKPNGLPYGSKESFGNWFGKACRTAGLQKGKAAHGLRKLAATLTADAGGTTHELMAHFGWSHPAQAEVYTRGADRARLGAQSSRRLAGEIENTIAHTLGQSAHTPNKKDGSSNA